MLATDVIETVRLFGVGEDVREFGLSRGLSDVIYMDAGGEWRCYEEPT